MSLGLMRYPKPQPFRSEVYKKWIRGWPCIVCGKHPVEAAHTGSHGLATQASDTTCLPLCAKCHRLEPDSYHELGETKFEEVHRLDLKQEVIRYLTEFIRTLLSEGDRY